MPTEVLSINFIIEASLQTTDRSVVRRGFSKDKKLIDLRTAGMTLKLSLFFITREVDGVISSAKNS